MVAPPSVAPELDEVAEGVGAWLRLRFSTAGVATIPRETMREHLPSSRADALQPDEVIALATKLGATHVVFPDLRLTSSQVEVRMRLVETGTQQLVAGARANASLGDVGEACESSAVRIFAFLGVSSRSGLPPRVDELASSGRALIDRDRGNYYTAWREVEHKLSPTAAAVRKDIARAAAQSAGSRVSGTERARVLAASGDAAKAWAIIERDLKRSKRQPKPDRALLLAAAEVELARGNPRDARAWVEKLLRDHSGNADVQRTYARVLMDQNDVRNARRALEQAVKLDPDDVVSVEQLAEFETEDRKRRAELLMMAGEREAKRLNAQRAVSLLDRASRTAPKFAADSWRQRGALQRRLGNAAESLTAFRKAVEIGGDDATSLRGIGDAERLLGKNAAAAKSYGKALVLSPKDSGSLYGMGAVHLANDEPGKAVPLFRKSVAAAPGNGLRRRNLAQALRATGDLDGALRELRNAPAGNREDGAKNLSLEAQIHTQQGNHEEARDTLIAAAKLEPFDPDLQHQLAAAYAATGDATRASRARELTALLRGETPTPDAIADAGEAGAEGSGHVRIGPSFDDLVASFADQMTGKRERPVAQLGVRDATTLRGHLYTWLHPRRPDIDAINASLDAALAKFFPLREAPTVENPVLVSHVDRVYSFAQESALDADSIAMVNQNFSTDAVFVALLDRAPEPNEEALSGCAADPGRFEIEVRMLSGQHPDVVGILANRQCITAGFENYGVLNERAAAVYGLLALFVLFPLLRGWGKVDVTIQVPPKTKGFFAIRVAKNEDEMPSDKAKKKSDSGRLKRSLRSLSRFERHMVGRQTVFRWIPARKRAYHVTVKGPLMDATGENIIGHFMETQRARVRRGKPVVLSYDFRPKECGVEIEVRLDGEKAGGARIAVLGVPASLRYARDGRAIIPMGEGVHQLLIGGNDRVAQYEVRIESLGRSIQVLAELADEHMLIFKDCPNAVEPFLIGDYGTAAQVLEADGHQHEAHRIRALLLRQMGSTDEAAVELEAAGELEAAAELRATGEDAAGSARLFEKAGDFDRAGDSYRAAQDFAAAARCFESAYDYDNALECYREAGEDRKALEILEKTGDFYEAGRLATELSDAERALVNLQQVEERDPRYGEACQHLADVLEARGDVDLAADKIQEALVCAGNNATAELHERHAQLLARAGRPQQAIDAYQTVRRIEPQRRDVTERIAALEREHAPEAPAGGPVDSRYEILGEVGRGAMGVVYKARDKNLGRIVALKSLPENLRDHPTAVALFQREAQAAAALNHRNIVTLFDAGEENGSYFITMELMEGLPLNQILKKRGRLSVADTLRLGIQVAAGLQYAKEQRIVHRDIKTGNLFFTKDRTVKIMDFGLAKTIEEVRKSSTMIGGTPYFMAPEQAAGDELDHRADLYAFGVTLYQLLTGTVPFREGDLAYHHRHTDPPDPRTHVPEIPAELAELILKMLAKSPGDRPEDAAWVGTRLKAILRVVSPKK